MTPRLLAISGLPGVGKTTVAAAIARRLSAVHLSIDAIEEALLGCGLPAGREVGIAAYEAARAIAELNLRLGADVVVDAVNDSDDARQTWCGASRSTGAQLLFVHLVISDRGEHRRRLEERDRGFAHVPEPRWDQVLLRAAESSPWTDEHLELDTAELPVHEVVDAVLARLAPS